MRHIPEEELHAYLDQALSRSQCVEIERHLAICTGCREARDGIAALRDRTTALLATLAPPAVFPPDFEELRRRAATELAPHRPRWGWWAASILLALGLGWTAHTLKDSQTGPIPPPVAAQSAPAGGADSLRGDTGTARVPLSEPEQSPTVAHHESPAVEPRRHSSPTTRPVSGDNLPVRPAQIETSVAVAPLPLGPADSGTTGDSLASQGSDAGLAGQDQDRGLWLLFSVSAAEEESGAPLARVQGLPVVQVKIQRLSPHEKIVAVDQQLASGQFIRTIDGPADRVTDLLSSQGRTPADAAADTYMAMRHGNRMVAVTGRVPVDSLRALLNRLSLTDH